MPCKWSGCVLTFSCSLWPFLLCSLTPFPPFLLSLCNLPLFTFSPPISSSFTHSVSKNHLTTLSGQEDHPRFQNLHLRYRECVSSFRILVDGGGRHLTARKSENSKFSLCFSLSCYQKDKNKCSVLHVGVNEKFFLCVSLNVSSGIDWSDPGCPPYDSWRRLQPLCEWKK